MPLGDPTTTPVFIVGLPRSGTTLTEHLLLGHPQIRCIGEGLELPLLLHRLLGNASSLQLLDQYHTHYRRLMDHWRANLPSHQLFDLRYESLVTSPQEEVPRLWEFLGLDTAVTTVARTEHAHVVRTASVDQDRQPIHARSLERWRKFAEQLALTAPDFVREEEEGAERPPI